MRYLKKLDQVVMRLCTKRLKRYGIHCEFITCNTQLNTLILIMRTFKLIFAQIDIQESSTSVLDICLLKSLKIPIKITCEFYLSLRDYKSPKTRAHLIIFHFENRCNPLHRARFKTFIINENKRTNISI